MEIKGKVAIVTGASNGFGKILSEKLVMMGGKVVLVDIDDKNGTALATKLNEASGQKSAVFYRCDLADPANINSMFDKALKEFDFIDILVNNAGIFNKDPWINDDSSGTQKMITINLISPIEAIRIAVKYFNKSNRPGCIVNIASSGWSIALDAYSTYCASKAAIVVFTASCKPLAELNPPIKVNAVAPGPSDTQIFDNEYELLERLKSNPQLVLKSESVVDQIIVCIEDESLSGETIEIFSGVETKIYKRDRPTKLSKTFKELIDGFK